MPIGISRRRYRHNPLVAVRQRVALSAGQAAEMADRRGRSTALGRGRRDGRHGEVGVVQQQPCPTPRRPMPTTGGCIVKGEGQLQRIAAIDCTTTGRGRGTATKTKEGRGLLQGEEGSPIDDHGSLIFN